MQPLDIPGPVPAPIDLRSMLRRHLVRRSLESLARGASARRAAFADRAALAEWSRGVRRSARDILGLGDHSSAPLNARVVSRHERRHHVIENLVFESIDGWQAGATLFLPHGQGPFLPIIVPCGHSGKVDRPHQLPPQVFARAGFAAIVFDPPAQGGEKNPGNDHFSDGPRCDAAGQTSQRYFVGDALRAMDYMQTRPDIDASRGFAMTGVSGGGMTTTWAALVDERVKAAGVVCCVAPLEEHPIRNGYATCPEPIPRGMIERGLGMADLMAALAPTPQLYIGGLRDEVFTEALAREVGDEVARAYALAGAGERFGMAFEDAGHDYTPAMARRFVAFIERHWLNEPGRAHSPAFLEEPELEPAEAMASRPAAEPNMRTISLAKIEADQRDRPRLSGRADAATRARRDSPGIERARIDEVTRGWRQASVRSDVEELLLRREGDICLPATALWPKREHPWGAVVMFDDRGRWASLARSGWLARASGHLNRSAGRAPAVLSVDLRGWGDSAPSATPWDLVGWAGLDRWHTYVANALGDPLMAQRTRDAAAACRWLLDQPGIDPRRIVVAGRGLGGIAALHAATTIEHVAGVVCIDTPQSLEAAVAEPRQPWGVDLFWPGALDLPRLAEALAPVLWVRPRDGQGRALREEGDEVAVEWVKRLV